MKSIVTLLAVAGLAGVAQAQAFPTNTNMVFEVWNGSAWSSTTNATPGSSVAFRVRAVWTGAAGAVSAFDSTLVQPYFSNADNSGASQDGLAPFARLASGTFGATSLTPAQAAATDTGVTGRVNFGRTAMQSSTFNVLTFFRHGGGGAQNGAPAGSFLRIAGSGTWAGSDNPQGTGANNQWPAASNPTGVAAEIQKVLRGINLGQAGDPLPAGAPYTFTAGTDVVVFRGAFVVSSDAGQNRTVSLTSDSSTLAREGGANSTDDRRRVIWKASNGEAVGGIKSSVAFVPATIVIPTPASIALMGLGGLVVARRRRA
jgi:hypothetical protein